MNAVRFHVSGQGSSPLAAARMARRAVSLMSSVSPASTAASHRWAVLRWTPISRAMSAANRTSATDIHSLNRSGVTASPRKPARRARRQSPRSKRFVAWSWQTSYLVECPRPEGRRRSRTLPVVPHVDGEDTKGQDLEGDCDVRQVLHRFSSCAGRDHPAPSAHSQYAQICAKWQALNAQICAFMADFLRLSVMSALPRRCEK